MYSFRLDEEIMDRAKEAAGQMGMSLSFFIRCLIKEKLGKGSEVFLTFRDNRVKVMREISTEIKKLRSDLKTLFKDKN
jgi:antitoxin component of RelBE/YafQ-DinJ toxin-antitoxin module